MGLNFSMLSFECVNTKSLVKYASNPLSSQLLMELCLLLVKSLCKFFQENKVFPALISLPLEPYLPCPISKK